MTGNFFYGVGEVFDVFIEVDSGVYGYVGVFGGDEELC